MNLLTVSHVRKILGGRYALDDVSLTWDGPGALALSGENGAGKSTLLRILAGILQPDAGTVTIAGHDLSRARLQALRHIGYAPEAADLPPHLGVGELISLTASLKRCDRPPPALAERLGAEGLLRKRFGSLSLGQRRRAGLLAALVGDPAILLLDEPTNGLDKDGVAVMIDVLREHAAAGRSAVVATHDRDFIAAVGAAEIKLREGKLVG